MDEVDTVRDIIKLLIANKLSMAKSLHSLMLHRNSLRKLYELNYLALVENETNRYFFKIYKTEDSKWEFFDYGYLHLDGSSATFYTLKSKLTIFQVTQIKHKIKRKLDNYLILVDDHLQPYLLYNINSSVIDLLIKKIKIKC